MSARLEIRWRARRTPLAPAALFAEGAACTRLVRALLLRSDEQLAEWSGLGQGGAILLLGDELPWADGVVYLGRDPAAPGLLFPTLVEPELPIDLVARALLARVNQRAPLAVIAAPLRLVPLGAARPIERARLRELFP